MADVAVRKETGYDSMAILPPFERLIFDEGHHLEDVATGYLSTQTSRQGLLRIAGRLQHPKKAQRGLLPQLSSLLSRTVPEALDDIYMEAAGVLEGRLIPRRTAPCRHDHPFHGCHRHGAPDHLGKGKELPGEAEAPVSLPGSVPHPFWQEVEERVRQLTEELEDDYAGGLRAFFKACEKFARTRCWNKNCREAWLISRVSRGVWRRPWKTSGSS